MNRINLKRKTQDTLSNGRDLVAAESLYKMANTTVSLVDNNLIPLSESYSKGNTSQNVDDMIRLANEAILILSSLSVPPLHLMQAHDFTARFNNKPNASQCTFEASCDEIKVHFRREEEMRYLIPERSFKYTTLDGRKSFVAPLKRIHKSLTRSKDHRIFKDARPSSITLSSLVRDAASRLPSGIGTRADICTLVRDSQYVIEDISDEVVKQVVSGALYRLGLEIDPCVKYNKGWCTYLHVDRE